MKERTSLGLLLVFVSAYILYFSFLSVLKYNSFSYQDFDLAVHALTSWNIVHGSIYNSILGIPFLGNHMQPIFFLLAPLYALFPHPLTLLLLQSLLLGLGAIPLYLIARKHINQGFALIIASGYLLYPGLAFVNLFEFHPTAFATFFLILSLYAYDFSRLKLFIAASILAMLCQENIPLAIIMVGVMAAFERKPKKWIFIPLGMAALYLIPALILMGYFNQNTVQFSSLYSHLGKSPWQALLNPGPALSFLFRKECLWYLFLLFLPVLFTPFLSWVRMLPLAPFLLQHMLSIRPSDLSISYHYTAELIPFVFFAAIYGIKALLTLRIVNRHAFVLKSALISFIIFCAVYFGPYINEAWRIKGYYKKDHLDVYKERLIARIPDSASTVATFEFLPRLANRKNLYSLHHAYMGFHTLSDKKYALADDVEYAVIDFNDWLTFSGFYSLEGYKNLQDIFLGSRWRLLDMVDSLVLLEKSPSDADFICSKLTARQDKSYKEILRVGDSLILIKANFLYYCADEALEAVFYWQSLEKTDKDIQMLIEITSEEGRVIRRLVHPICYRIFPTHSWEKGDSYKEKVRIYMPEESPDDINISVVFIDNMSGGIIQAKSGNNSYTVINLGVIRCRE
ncbi:MAG: DUF2079 domain-containing protein [Candidatus Omnitrophica bacterium]|nr:DUF2079 domain-containing protein [Candidatus Omnitrophota bacterium]